MNTCNTYTGVDTGTIFKPLPIRRITRALDELLQSPEEIAI